MPHCPSWLKTIFKLTLTAFFGGTIIICAAVLYLAPQLPSVEQLRDVRLQTPLKVFSSDGKLIGEFGEQKRTPIRFDQIPQHYISALLAAEDDNFFNHNGVDLFGLLRAVSQILTTGDIQSGGSTITMQVARNFFLTLDQTFIRKFNEILLAFQIEHELTKEEILELYANKMYLGKRAYGIQAAANVYYGKNIEELNLSQLGMIAGLYKAPTTKNPINNPEAALIRRDWILGRMRLLDYIDEAGYQQALAEPVTAQQHGSIVEVDSPYVAEMVRSEMYSRYGADAYVDGYEVITSIHSNAQESAQEAVLKGVRAYDERHGYRGPEASVDSTVFGENDQLISYLGEIPVVANLIPAMVVEITEQSATVFVRDHGYIELGWEQGISEAAPFMTHSWRGEAPETVAEVLQPGDLIRVELDENEEWQLAQTPAAQAALVALDPLNGAIRALTGGFDFYQNRFNRVSSAKRQPGSNLKPFLYASALEHDFTAATLVNDAPIVFEDAALEDIWRPENDSGKFYGPTRLREALYHSRNLVSIRVLRSLGISETRDEMMRFGFGKEDLATNLTLALGSEALEPIKLARAYAVFANGGYLIEPYFIEKIIDRRGDVLFQANPPQVCRNCDDEPLEEEKLLGEENFINAQMLEELSISMLNTPASAESETPVDVGSANELTIDSNNYELSDKNLEAEEPPLEPIYAEQVLDPRVHFIMDSILKDVIQRGTGRKARVLERGDLAGKTGTTNGPKDGWFSGYSPDLVTTVWLGFDDNSLLGNSEFGDSTALPIWIDFMRDALTDVPEYYFEQPQGLVIARINAETGERARPEEPNAMFEYFLKENTPPLSSEMSGANTSTTEAEINTGTIF